MRVIMLFDVPVIAGRTADAEARLLELTQKVANRLRQGASVDDLCKHPPRDPNRSASVTIERLDQPDEPEWTPESIDRFLDELDRQSGD